MIGILIQQDSLECVFKCFQPETPLPTLSVVSLRKHEEFSPGWLVVEHKSMENLTKKEYADSLTFWMDSFVFKTRKLHEKLPKNTSEMMKLEFNTRILLNKKNEKYQCIIPEETISHAILRDKEKCIGFMKSTKENVRFLKTREDFDTLKSFTNSMMPSRITKLGSSLLKNSRP